MKRRRAQRKAMARVRKYQDAIQKAGPDTGITKWEMRDCFEDIRRIRRLLEHR